MFAMSVGLRVVLLAHTLKYILFVRPTADEQKRSARLLIPDFRVCVRLRECISAMLGASAQAFG